MDWLASHRTVEPLDSLQHLSDRSRAEELAYLPSIASQHGLDSLRSPMTI